MMFLDVQLPPSSPPAKNPGPSNPRSGEKADVVDAESDFMVAFQPLVKPNSNPQNAKEVAKGLVREVNSSLGSNEADKGLVEQIEALQVKVQELMEEMGLSSEDILSPEFLEKLGLNLSEKELKLAESLLGGALEGEPSNLVLPEENHSVLLKISELLSRLQTELASSETGTAFALDEVDSLEKMKMDLESKPKDEGEAPERIKGTLLTEKNSDLSSTLQTSLESKVTPIGTAVQGGGADANPNFSAASEVSTPSQETKQNVMEQVRMGFSAVLKNGVKHIQIQLMPEHLGKIQISLELKSEVLSGKIIVQNESVKQIVEGQLQQLKDSLTSQNYDVEELQVSLESESNDFRDFAAENEWKEMMLLKQSVGAAHDDGMESLNPPILELDTGRRWGYNTMEYIA